MSIARKYALRGAPGVDRCCCCSVLTWFGLLSPGKGIETTIVAVSQLVERHPEVLLVVAGRTHPGVVREQIVSRALTFAVAAGCAVWRCNGPCRRHRHVYRRGPRDDGYPETTWSSAKQSWMRCRPQAG